MPPSKFKNLRLNPDIKQLPPFDFINDSNIQIIQSCVGLLLCVSRRDDSVRYFIYNPTTSKFKVIFTPSCQVIYNYDYVAKSLCLDPSKSIRLLVDDENRASVNLSSDPTIQFRNHVGVNLAFDPLKSPHYKIFSIWKQTLFGKNPESTTCYIFHTYIIDIYSSEIDSWNFSKLEFYSKHYVSVDYAVFYNGAIHWDCPDTQSWYIDVNNECLKTMPMPSVDNGYRYFGESGGHLHLAVAIGFSQLRFKIFQMEADYSDWSFKYNVSLEVESFVVVPRHQQNLLRSYLLSCVVQADEENGDTLLIVLPRGKAVSYNLVHGTVRRLHCSNIDKLRNDVPKFRAFKYLRPFLVYETCVN